MLVKYKKDYKKIAMGLLSFIPELKDIAQLQDEIKWYEKNNNILYLWKNENKDFSGIIGIEISLDEEIIIVRQIAISPSDRNQGTCYKILDELSALYPKYKMMGNIDMTSLITKWEHKKLKINLDK